MMNNNFTIEQKEQGKKILGQVVRISAICDRFKCIGIVERVEDCNAYVRVLTGEMANTLVKVFIEECKLVQFDKGADSVKDVLSIIETFKPEQVQNFKACLIHLFSCVHGDIEHFQSDDSIYFKITCGRYSICIGLQLTDNGFKVVRKNKAMKFRGYYTM